MENLPDRWQNESPKQASDEQGIKPALIPRAGAKRDLVMSLLKGRWAATGL